MSHTPEPDAAAHSADESARNSARNSARESPESADESTCGSAPGLAREPTPEFARESNGPIDEALRVASGSGASGTPFDEPIARLVRFHNLMIFVVFLAGLIAFATAYTLHRQRRAFELGDGWRYVLIGLRIVLPIAALVLTGLYTRWRMRLITARIEQGTVGPTTLYNSFQRCKLMSVLLLTMAGLFASVCLVLGHRWIDLILALAPFLLLVVTRPGLGGFLAYVAAVQPRDAT